MRDRRGEMGGEGRIDETMLSSLTPLRSAFS